MNNLTGLIYFVGTFFLHTFLKELAKDFYTYLKSWIRKHTHRLKHIFLATKHICWGWVDVAFNPYFLWGSW